MGLVVYADRGEGGQEGGRGVSGKPSGGCCQRSLVHVSRELCSPATLFARAVCVLFVIGWLAMACIMGAVLLSQPAIF